MDILSQGINFDKKRFNSDISAFKRQKKVPFFGCKISSEGLMILGYAS